MSGRIRSIQGPDYLHGTFVVPTVIKAMSTMRYYKERIPGSIFFYSMLILLLERSQSSTNPETERREKPTHKCVDIATAEKNFGEGGRISEVVPVLSLLLALA